MPFMYFIKGRKTTRAKAVWAIGGKRIKALETAAKAHYFRDDRSEPNEVCRKSDGTVDVRFAYYKDALDSWYSSAMERAVHHAFEKCLTRVARNIDAANR